MGSSLSTKNELELLVSLLGYVGICWEGTIHHSRRSRTKTSGRNHASTTDLGPHLSLLWVPTAKTSWTNIKSGI